MEITDKIKKIIFKYWKDNGIDLGNNFFTMFGVDITHDDEIITDLLIEYYGGLEKTMERLDKLKNEVIEVTEYGGTIRFKIINFTFDKGDKHFYYDVFMDGGVLLSDEDGNEQTTYDIWLEEGLDRGFTNESREYIEDIFYDKISSKSGFNFNLENLTILKPGEFN